MRHPLARSLRRAAAGLILAVVAACGSAAPSDSTRDHRPTALAGTTWEVVLLNDVAPIAGHAPTVSFTSDAVQGSSGCNHFGGRYRFAAGELRFEELGGTAMACVDRRVMDMEALFMRLLGGVTVAEVDEAGRLVLLGAPGRIVLRPGPGPAVPPSAP